MPGTILIVDDEMEILGMVAAVLRKAGYEAVMANSPAEAIAVCEDRNRRVDLVLSDFEMPGLSGAQLADSLSVLRPNLETILMSGNPIVGERLEMRDLTFLSKPFSFEDLLYAIRERLATSTIRIV